MYRVSKKAYAASDFSKGDTHVPIPNTEVKPFKGSRQKNADLQR